MSSFQHKTKEAKWIKHLSSFKVCMKDLKILRNTNGRIIPQTTSLTFIDKAIDSRYVKPIKNSFGSAMIDEPNLGHMTERGFAPEDQPIKLFKTPANKINKEAFDHFKFDHSPPAKDGMVSNYWHKRRSYDYLTHLDPNIHSL